MRRILQLSILCGAIAAAGACSRDKVISTEDIPTAGVRFINAVPDTGAAFGLDFRFVDLAESNSHFRITFRNTPTASGGVTGSTQIQYKNARAGSRHFRIFLDDTIQTVAATVLKDSTVTLEAGKLYTFLLWGRARSTGADKMQLKVIEENVADPGTQVALRVINATGAAVDVRQYVSTGTVPAAPTWANVPAYGISSYVTAAPAQIKYNVQPAGGGSALVTDGLALIGNPNGTQVGGCTVGVDCEGAPGTTVAGSAITAIIFPPSVAGSKAPQGGGFNSALLSFMWDRRAARACTTLC
ncbi:MAG: DUF4397 domain-containing protein [Myxococcales bacterium]